ncbi:PH domain profile [Nakaseomyces glabratus]|nr:Bud site selection protein bud4 [Nakaseomyces glabratus]
MEAETTVDSLLKEIDMEMEMQSGNDVAQSNGYLLPLQEIGDETMDMLVQYNTENNANSNANANANANANQWNKVDDPQDLLPMENNYDDDEEQGDESDTTNLLSGNKHLTEEESEQVLVDSKNLVLPPSSSKSNLINNLKQVVEDEVSDSQLSNDMDDTRTLNFSVKGTEPLLADELQDKEPDMIEVSTIYDGPDMISMADDSDTEDIDLLSKAKKPVSPSKIPITNAQTINYFKDAPVEDAKLQTVPDDIPLETKQTTVSNDILSNVETLLPPTLERPSFVISNLKEASQSVENLGFPDYEEDSQSEQETSVLHHTPTDFHAHEFEVFATELPDINVTPSIKPIDNDNNCEHENRLVSEEESKGVISSVPENENLPAVKSNPSSNSISDMLEIRQENKLDETLNMIDHQLSSNKSIDSVKTVSDNNISKSANDGSVEDVADSGKETSDIARNIEESHNSLINLTSGNNFDQSMHNDLIEESNTRVNVTESDITASEDSFNGSHDQNSSLNNLTKNDNGIQQNLEDNHTGIQPEMVVPEEVTTTLPEVNILPASENMLENTSESEISVQFLQNKDNEDKVSSDPQLEENIRSTETVMNTQETFEPKPAKKNQYTDREIEVLNSQKYISEATDNSAVNSRISSSASNFTPVLPPLPKLEKLSIDDPFDDEFETSNESMQMKNSVKPTDYLSIWHLQEQTTKAVSPALSSNSQFSYNSNSTKSSVASPVPATAFKFKPKIVSRSKYYYPDNNIQQEQSMDFIYTKLPSILDPMRRNTINSKKIRQTVIDKRKSHPSFSVDEGNTITEVNIEPEVKVQPISIENDSSSLKANNQDDNESCSSGSQAFVTPSATMDNFDSQFNELGTSFENDLENVLNYFDKDINTNTSSDLIEETTTKNQALPTSKVWSESVDYSLPTGEEPNVDHNIMKKLLNTENSELDECRSDQEHHIIDNAGLGIWRSTANDIATGNVDMFALNGRDISISKSEMTNDIDMGIFSDKKSLVHTPELSPVKSTHVGSPFKVISPKKNTQKDLKDGTTAEKRVSSESEAAQISIMSAVGEITNKDTAVVDDASNKDNIDAGQVGNEGEPIVDKGLLYLHLQGTTKLSLAGINAHHPKYSIEFDNGKNVVRTDWTELDSRGTISLDKEFEIPIDQSINKLIITLMIKYTRLTNELVEVTKRIPIGKKFPFGKMKYRTETQFVERSTVKDEWDYLFARDGSFGRCEILLDESLFEKIRFKEQDLSFDLLNKWSRLQNNSSSKVTQEALYDLPRRPAYKVGSLKVKGCFLERVSNDEKFPVSLKKAKSIVEKYRSQQDITKEGYLLQEGGDLSSQMKNRFFKLNGVELVGYHEVSMKPKIRINMLKVVKVIGKDDVVTGKDNVKNFTTWVLMNDCFQLVFDDGEVITFSDESSLADEQSWYMKLKEVVELNAFHQPWVKRFSENMIINDI